MKNLLDDLKECKHTLVELNISDNKSVNRAVPELVNLILVCKKLRSLTISDLSMKKRHCKSVA
jgi:hypothetical protein